MSSSSASAGRFVTIVMGLLALASVGIFPNALAGGLEPSPTPQNPPGYDAFVEEFEKARSIGATNEMTKLVARQTSLATQFVVNTSLADAFYPTELSRDRLAALTRAWKSSLKTGFVGAMREWFGELGEEKLRQYRALTTRYNTLNRKFFDMLQAKDGEGLDACGEKFELLAAEFVAIGDHFSASQIWLAYANCFDNSNRGQEADLEKAGKGYARCVQHREAVELIDAPYQQASLRVKHLDIELSNPIGEASAKKNLPPAVGAAVRNVMSFELVSDLYDYQRPVFAQDDVHMLWSALYMHGENQPTARFQGMGEAGPLVQRLSGTDVRVDTDGDGVGDLPIPLRSRATPFLFSIGSGNDRREWACLTMIGTELDTYNGVQLDYSPNSQSLRLFFLNAASVAGEVAGEALRVLDDNLDGFYGSAPHEYDQVGLEHGLKQPELDSVVIGSGKRAVPWSEYQNIAGQWHRLETASFGRVLTSTPVEIETGKLRLKFSGGKPAWLVVRGSGAFRDSYFDLAGARGGVELPAGEYSLYYGGLRKGKALRVAKCVILPTRNTPRWTVEPGKTTDIELGAPFSFEFDFENEADEVVVKGQSVVVLGRAGERYGRTWNCVPRPEVSYRKAGSRKASKPEDMAPVLDQDQLRKHSPADRQTVAAWYPLDLTLEKRKNEPEVEVQLVEKGNKLFGTITSAWKASSAAEGTR